VNFGFLPSKYSHPINSWKDGEQIMATMTITIPDDKANRLKAMSQERGISVNKLIDELSTVAIAEHDTLTRFRLRASRGDARRGLEILDKLDRCGQSFDGNPCA